MDYIQRDLESVCHQDLKHFPVLTLTWPRQSGKSTLLRHLLPNWDYVNLEDVGQLEFALNDPKGFVAAHPDHAIFDEIQRAPKLLSQIQVSVDNDRRPGRFAVTGSHNLMFLESVSQSLAGRTSVRHLLPFSYAELSAVTKAPKKLNEAMFFGGYAPVHRAQEAALAWWDSYSQTYVEIDVRLIRNVTDLATFRRFLRLCAGRVGQLVDLSSLGGDAGVSHNTVRDWIGILETSFVAFRLEPYFRNFSKRIIKSPKLYFYDTGLLCRLLNIRSADELEAHPFRGHIFENWCVVEALKAQLNSGQRPALYFWRDQKVEVDLIIDYGSNRVAALECKSGATAVTEFMDAALKFKAFADGLSVTAGVIYGGDEDQPRSQGQFYSWISFAQKIGSGSFP